MGNVAIGPGDVLALRGAAGIEQGGLREQHKRTLGVAAVPHRIFRAGDLLHAASQMQGCRTRTLGSFPRNRLRKCVVHLEHSWPLAITLQPAVVGRSETLCSHAQKLTRSDITERGVELPDGVQSVHATRSPNGAPELV